MRVGSRKPLRTGSGTIDFADPTRLGHFLSMYLNQRKVDTAPSRAGLLYGKIGPDWTQSSVGPVRQNTYPQRLRRTYIGLTLFNYLACKVTLLAKVSGPQYYWKFFPPERASQHLRDCHASHARNGLAALSLIPVPQCPILFLWVSSLRLGLSSD